LEIAIGGRTLQVSSVGRRMPASIVPDIAITAHGRSAAAVPSASKHKPRTRGAARVRWRMG
jgi:hypothetical protein